MFKIPTKIAIINYADQIGEVTATRLQIPGFCDINIPGPSTENTDGQHDYIWEGVEEGVRGTEGEYQATIPKAVAATSEFTVLMKIVLDGTGHGRTQSDIDNNYRSPGSGQRTINLISGAIASMSPSEVAKEMERAYIRDVYDGTTIFDPEIYQLMPSLVGLDNEVVFTVHPNYTPTSIGFSTSVVLVSAEITTNTPSIDNENTGDFIHETWQHETTRNLDYYGVHNAVDMAKADDLYDLTVIAIRRGLNYSPGYYVNGVENDGYVTYGIFINATAGLNAVALLAAFTASLHPLD